MVPSPFRPSFFSPSPPPGTCLHGRVAACSPPPTATSRSRALTANATGELNVLRHDGDALCVDGAEVSVLEEADEVRLGRLLKREHGVRLEAKIRLEILRDLADEALEGKLANQQLGGLLVLPARRGRGMRGGKTSGLGATAKNPKSGHLEIPRGLPEPRRPSLGAPTEIRAPPSGRKRRAARLSRAREAADADESNARRARHSARGCGGGREPSRVVSAGSFASRDVIPETLSRRGVAPNLAERDGAGPVAVRLLHAAGGGRGLARRLSGELFAGGLASGGLARGLLRTSHGASRGAGLQ